MCAKGPNNLRALKPSRRSNSSSSSEKLRIVDPRRTRIKSATQPPLRRHASVRGGARGRGGTRSAASGASCIVLRGRTSKWLFSCWRRPRGKASRRRSLERPVEFRAGEGGGFGSGGLALPGNGREEGGGWQSNVGDASGGRATCSAVKLACGQRRVGGFLGEI